MDRLSIPVVFRLEACTGYTMHRCRNGSKESSTTESQPHCVHRRAGERMLVSERVQPAGLRELITAMTEPDPAARPKLREVLSRLHGILHGLIMAGERAEYMKPLWSEDARSVGRGGRVPEERMARAASAAPPCTPQASATLSRATTAPLKRTAVSDTVACSALAQAPSGQASETWNSQWTLPSPASKLPSYTSTPQVHTLINEYSPRPHTLCPTLHMYSSRTALVTLACRALVTNSRTCVLPAPACAYHFSHGHTTQRLHAFTSSRVARTNQRLQPSLGVTDQETLVPTDVTASASGGVSDHQHRLPGRPSAFDESAEVR
jgi:hypothetical protein